MKKLLLISFVLMITFIVSCGKKEEANVSISNNAVYVSSPENVYNKTYTNVVKIQGKFVNMNSAFSYADREEGEYSEDYDIFEAIENHSLKRVMELIEEGEDIDQNDRDFTMYSEFIDSYYIIESATPLIFAIFYRDFGIMKYLLDNGADPYIKNENGRNSFLWACGVGNVDVIKMLVEFDSDLVDSQDRFDANGLHIAARNDNVEVFEYLVNDLSIDVNSTNEYGEKVLDYAEKDETIEKLK
ncbi:ankyrin repeat domain-containing protein [Brachyspira hyodysenteriae]|uniref:ankyrin repeat domain-containing protein n=2 Tax=Brachyspira hyodysenteriae TaxID=159 RepID=UPI00063DB5A0|nr:ankyrin repeat domain-containing protein [Brachyspira hyodysenteriae]KLI47302.1 ankyrin [Brachyspira hyodysenteriae]MBT8719688.1 ankyrin repeat domain-containing protein [Brachyspira hyodysenteriae]MBT8729927.1 ankyrin repeat domain-containing protein [Brachyspira hyodysenteriae]MBT8732096.1 ankyrin repeat domain-containing protein [Brachyspira hyodysenteriae]MBT8734550.1 ankyrin repeat domain-containing protein [Brachyspira hyodysenteriae]